MHYRSTLETLESFWNPLSKCSAYTDVGALAILYRFVKVSSTVEKLLMVVNNIPCSLSVIFKHAIKMDYTSTLETL